MIGKQIKHYRVDRLIGEGGMGSVYLGWDGNLDRQVAIKVLHPQLWRDGGTRERFKNEARIQAKLCHPNIVAVHDYDADSGAIIMEYVAGRNLNDLIITETGPLAYGPCVEIMRQALAAIGYAHSYRGPDAPGGVVHRDIKPSNIALLKSGSQTIVKVMDFGIAKLVGSADARTTTGVKLGTLSYMSPEQLTSPRGITHLSDIYSLGVTLYKMTTGAVPFEGDTEFQVMEKIISAPPPSPRSLNAGISPQLEHVILTAMAKKPEDRYPGCDEFLAALLAVSDTGDRGAWKGPLGSGEIKAVREDEASADAGTARYDCAGIERQLEAAVSGPAVSDPSFKNLQELMAERELIDQKLEDALMRPVSVMFTDIKGSTSYFERRGDLAGLMMVERHNRLLFPVIRESGGEVVKTIGDAIMARFDEAPAAARAARLMQRRLKEHNSCQAREDRIRIRIGINYGRGMIKDNDVFGDVVNVAARVEALCPPGQIFISGSMCEQLQKDPDFRVQPFTPTLVRGKEEAIEVFRLFWDDREEEEDAPIPPRPRPAPVAGESGLLLDFQASLAGGVLESSLSERKPGEQAAVRESENHKVNAPELNALCANIYQLLDRVNQPGAAKEELLDELKSEGKKLFDLVFTPAIQERLNATGQDDLLVSINEELVQVPWELCYDGNEFLGRRFNLGRVVSTHQRVRRELRRRPSPSLRILVVSAGGKKLAGAVRESGRLVEELSRLGGSVEAEVSKAEGPRELLRRFPDFDIIHYSGHSVYDGETPESSGWELTSGKLEARALFEVQKGPMPSLVFSNSCRSGQTEPWKDSHRLAFSLGNAFLVNGVRHFIGTFQDVSDESSAEIALPFYRRLLQGEKIGAALKLARKELAEARGEADLTWAGYALYGDPTTVYHRQVEIPDIPSKPPRKASRRPVPWTALTAGAAVIALIAILAVFRPFSSGPDPFPAIVGLINAGKFSQARGELMPLATGRKRPRALFLQAASHLDEGDAARALPLLEELNKLGEDQPGPRIIAAEISLSRGEFDSAGQALTQALAAADIWWWEKARAENLSGRLAEHAGDKAAARSCYEQALAADPDFYPALMNLALLYEGSGDLERSRSLLEHCRRLRPDDPVLTTLSKDTEDRISYASDTEAQARVQALITELSAAPKPENQVPDPWTTRPVTVSVMGITSSGGLLARGGQGRYLELKIHELFERTDLPVVERRLMEQMLSEMKLSQSQVADPDAALRLGRLLAARFIVSGSLTFMGSEVEVGLRVIETETGLIQDSYSKTFAVKDDYIKDVREYVETMAADLRSANPVRGRVLMTEGDETVLNIGSKTGLKQGDRLRVYRADEVRPVEKSGRVVAFLEPAAPAGEVEVSVVEPEVARAKIVDGSELAAGMMVSKIKDQK